MFREEEGIDQQKRKSVKLFLIINEKKDLKKDITLTIYMNLK